MRAHLRYAKYLVRHKWFVFVAGRRTKAPFWRLVIHDYTKLMPVEWRPYVAYFYGDRNQATFERAWLHHLHRNPHHHQYWTLRNDDGTTKTLPMPENFIREMVADWAGAGRAITGKWEVAEWYEKNKGRIVLEEGTERRVRQLLLVVAP